MLDRIDKDEGDESVSLSFSKTCCQCKFLKYSKEGRSSLSHVGIRHISMCHIKNKAGVRCAKRTPSATFEVRFVHSFCFFIVGYLIPLIFNKI